MKKISVYEIITNKIIDQLEKGIIPWRMPWSKNGLARNWKTQRPYRGINAMLLAPGEYLTFKQVQEAGGKVKKGAKGQTVVFWKFPKDQEEGEAVQVEDQKRAPILRYYNVFRIDDTEGIESKTIGEEWNHDPIQEAERIAASYQNGPSISFAPGKAFYRPSADQVSIPSLSDYRQPEEYYSTLFHELAHSTGHHSRLNRTGVVASNGFGSEIYSEEELVAEMAAAMLCGVARIENVTLENSAAYIGSWIRKLKSDPKMIIKAGSAAQKAADWIQGVTHEVH